MINIVLQGFLAIFFIGQSLAQANLHDLWQYRADAVHYKTPLMWELHNTSNKPITYTLPMGTVFVSDAPKIPKFILAEEISITVPAKKKLGIWAKTYALEMDLPMPKGNEKFKPTAIDTQMLPLLKFMEEQKWVSIECQQAVWVLYNKLPLVEVYGYRHDQVIALQAFLANLMGVEKPMPPSKDDHLRNYEAADENKYKVFLGGKISMRLNSKSVIEMALFDQNNRFVRELLIPKERIAGMHTIRYSFDASLYQGHEFVIRVFANNEVLIEKPVSAK